MFLFTLSFMGPKSQYARVKGLNGSPSWVSKISWAKSIPQVPLIIFVPFKPYFDFWLDKVAFFQKPNPTKTLENNYLATFPPLGGVTFEKLAPWYGTANSTMVTAYCTNYSPVIISPMTLRQSVFNPFTIEELENPL